VSVETPVEHGLRRVLPDTASVDGRGHLHVGGCDTTELVRQFGTPVFVFCEATFRERARAFRGAFPGATVHYAAKAFQCLAMCQLVAEEGLGIDVASGGELHTALAAGFPPERMVLHGNNKAEAELARAVAAGVGTIALDNLEEIDRVAELASAAGRRQRVVVRVTPGVEAHTHEYIQTGHEDTKFGVSVEGGAAREALARAAARDSLDLAGVHAHIGSNIFSAEPFVRTIEILFGLVAGVRGDLGIELEELNLGGGIGVPYLPEDEPVRLDAFASLVQTSVEDQAARHGIPVPSLTFEPGRFLVANAMVTLYSVGVIKDLPGIRTYVCVDGGMSDNIRPALYHARYAALLANKAADPPGRTVTVAGMHCESGDVLLRNVGLPASTERGDLLAIPATGAYGYSMASNYNHKPRPPVVLVRGGDARVIVRRETLDDLLRLDEPLS
jgi:diaminopimelate decarboxylase